MPTLMQNNKSSYPLHRKGLSIIRLACVVTLGCLVTSGCAPIKRYAMNQVATVLSDGTATFHSDDDPQLIREALPFSLKLIEGILNETPHHQGLLTRACSGFTEYAYAFIKQDADEIEEDDFEASQAMRLRAKKLFLRARGYGLRALALRHKGFTAALKADPKQAVSCLTPNDVEIAYWLGASWGAAISVGKDDPDLIADQIVVEALLDRCLALDAGWDHGSIHGILISYEMARQGADDKPENRARKHFEKAVKLSGGQNASPYVSYAESVLIQLQKRKEFRATLQTALAIDPDARPEWRMLNLVMQRRAQWLLDREDDLFFE